MTTPSHNGYHNRAAYLEALRQDYLGLAHAEERRAGAVTQTVLALEAKAAKLAEEIQEERRANG